VGGPAGLKPPAEVICGARSVIHDCQLRQHRLDRQLHWEVEGAGAFAVPSGYRPAPYRAGRGSPVVSGAIWVKISPGLLDSLFFWRIISMPKPAT